MADLNVLIALGYGRSQMLIPPDILSTGLLVDALGFLDIGPFIGFTPLRPAITSEAVHPGENTILEPIQAILSGGVVAPPASASTWMIVPFSWSAVGGATSYQLEIGLTSGGTEYEILNVGNVLSYDKALPPGTYYTRVRGVSGVTLLTASAEQVVYV